MSLSDRIRPNSEAAQWVVDEVKQLESKLSASQAREAALREKLADREAAFEARTIDFNSAYNANIAYAEQVRELKRENAELRKLLEESKVPEVTDICAERAVEFISKASFLHHPDIPYLGTENGDDEKKWNTRLVRAMLEYAMRAPQPKEQPSPETDLDEALRRQ